MVPQCQPVVEPDRQIAAPTSASTEPATCTSLVPSPLTAGVAVHSLSTLTQDMSLPGKTEASTVPWSTSLKPVVLPPGFPQCPAPANPCCPPLVTENPTEQRAFSSL